MALPQAVSGSGLLDHNILFEAAHNSETRPWKSSAGAVYLAGPLFGSTNALAVLKSTDPTASGFSEVSVATRPYISGTVSCSFYQLGDLLYFADRNSGSNGHVFSIFDMATDTWATRDQSIGSTVASDVAIAARSDGTVIAVTHNSRSVMGTTRATLDMRIRSSGGTWGSATEIYLAPSDTTSASVNWIAVGASDLALVTFCKDPLNDLAPMFGISVTSANSVGTETAITSGVVGCGYTHDQNPGSDTLYFRYESPSSGNSWLETVTIATTPSGSASAAFTGQHPIEYKGGGVTLADDGVLRNFRIHSASAPSGFGMYMIHNPGGTWTRTLHRSLTSGLQGHVTPVSRFTLSGTERHAFLYAVDGTSGVFYDEYTTGAAPATRPIERARAAMSTAACRAGSF